MYILKKADKLDIYVILLVVVLYGINIYVKKTTDIIFFEGYFNDILCPIATLALINILLSCYHKKLKSLPVIMLLMLIFGSIWEYANINPLRVADNLDIVCYEIGGLIYWFILKCKRELKKL